MIHDNTVLKDEYKDQLFDYQVGRINQIFQEFCELNSSQNSYEIQSCPKCGTKNPVVTKGGFSNSGKQMYRCQSCNKRFVEDNGRLTFYSHQGSDKWSDFIKATLQTKSLKDCAALIDVHEHTAFRMRHKFLNFLEAAAAVEIEEKPLENEVEFDETYYHEMHKGLKPREIVQLEDEINHVEHARFRTCEALDAINERLDQLKDELHQKKGAFKEKHRGLSKDLVCVVTGVERLGGAVIKATNMARPGSDDIRQISSALKDGSYAFIDGCSAYFSVLDEKHCPYTICPSQDSYHSIQNIRSIS